jgi:hypothetical protein
MAPTPRHLLLGLAFLAALVPPAPAQNTTPLPQPSPSVPSVPSIPSVPSSSPLSAPALADFTWFSSLGFPDVQGKPFGHYQDGTTQSSDDPTPVPRYVNGFLLSHSLANSTILTLTLDQPTFSVEDLKERPGMGPFQPLSLNTTALAIAQSLPTVPRDDFSQFLSYRTQIFILAWACWRNHLPDLAAQLYAGAQTLPDPHSRTAPIPDFHTALQNDLGSLTFSRALESLGYPRPGITRPAFVAQLQTILKNYPLSAEIPVFQHFLDSFQKTIAEDATYLHISDADLAQLPIEARIPELIYQLRNVTGGGEQMISGSGPFWGNPFLTHGENGTPFPPPGFVVPPGKSLPASSAADELLDLGTPAVPALIASLNDTTYTRNAASFGGLAGNNSLQHVNQLSLQILEAIAHKKFYEYGAYQLLWKHNPDKSYDESIPPESRAAVADWWSSFQSKGEKQTLIDAVSAGDLNSDAQAQILLQKYPDAAVPALIQGIANANTTTLSVNSPDYFQKNDIRRNLVADLGKSSDPAATAALQNILAHDPSFSARITAASALIAQGRPPAELLPPVLDAWHAFLAAPPLPQGPGRSETPRAFITFLLKYAPPDTVTDTFIDGVRQSTDVNLRVMLIDALSAPNDPTTRGMVGLDPNAPSPALNPNNPKTLAFFQDDVKTDSSLQVRAAIANILYQRGDQDIVPIMISIWETYAAQQPPPSSGRGSFGRPSAYPPPPPPPPPAPGQSSSSPVPSSLPSPIGASSFSAESPSPSPPPVLRSLGEGGLPPSPPPPPPPPPPPQRGPANPIFQPIQLLAFLTECDSPAAINSIAAHLAQCSPSVRGVALNALYQGSLGHGAPDRRSYPPGAIPKWPVSSATLDAIEAAFISELTDKQATFFRPPDTTDAPRISGARVCDVAAYYLAQRFPQKYQFDPNGPAPDRDTQIAVLLATYHKTHQPPVLSITASNPPTH